MSTFSWDSTKIQQTFSDFGAMVGSNLAKLSSTMLCSLIQTAITVFLRETSSFRTFFKIFQRVNYVRVDGPVVRHIFPDA